MLDHVSLQVLDLDAALRFYDAVLAPLAGRRVLEFPDRDAVTAFFKAAVRADAEVLHEPRLWPEYHPGYFGAFVRDPDGNNVEAVHHTFSA